MKALFLSLLIAGATFTAYCQGNYMPGSKAPVAINDTYTDTVKLQVDGTNAYYAKTVRVDSSITESKIYLRSLEFMASKNFQQNYGYDEEGKLICTTTQDLNTNEVYVGDDSDNVDPYTVQFTITIDMKNRRYRYTINNVVFFRPTETGNRRLTLYDVYVKATNTSSKRVAKDAKKVISSFERYITTLTNELHQAIELKQVTDNPKF